MRRSSRRSERTHSPRRYHAQIEPLLARQRLELHLQPLEHLLQGKDGDLGLEPARVQPRYLDQHAQDLLDRLERGVDVAGERAPPGRRPCAPPGWWHRAAPH